MSQKKNTKITFKGHGECTIDAGDDTIDLAGTMDVIHVVSGFVQIVDGEFGTIYVRDQAGRTEEMPRGNAVL